MPENVYSFNYGVLILGMILGFRGFGFRVWDVILGGLIITNTVP